MSRLLVTDGDERAALAIVRSLGRAGHTVFVCARNRRSIAGASRHASGQAALPDPLREPVAFTDGIRAAVERWSIDIVIPVTDASLMALLPARSEFGDTNVLGPTIHKLLALANKPEVLRTAGELGIAIPGQMTLNRREELDFDTIAYPVVVKPARSVSDSGGTRSKWTVTHAANAEQLRERIRALADEAFPVLLQQRIVGPGVGVFVLLWTNIPLAIFSHRRLREKPPSGGVSVYSESIRPDPGLVELSLALLRRFGWEGVAMVEYKIDADTGTPYLMEINGRFWGSLQLAITSGVDFPLLLLKAAAGEQPAPVNEYRIGERNRWWWGDVDHLITRWRRSATALNLPAGHPTRLEALAQFLSFSRRDHNEVLQLKDPVPFLIETMQWFRNR